MKGLGARSRAGIAVVLLSAAFGAVAARAQTATAPPAPGGWGIGPDVEPGTPAPVNDDFKGGFTVTSGLAVSGLHGVTQPHVNSGCIKGVKITMVGSYPIHHFLAPATATDVYEVSDTTGMLFQKVTLMLQRNKRHAKKHRASAELRIYFPGGTATFGGYTTYSNMTYSSSVGGTCNLRFAVSG